MKFQWSKDKKDYGKITWQQLEWLLEGLEIEQKKAHHTVSMNSKNTGFKQSKYVQKMLKTLPVSAFFYCQICL